jgi:methylmalonyl-CoA/ethylmalonyl-CoA epimerase
MNLKKIDHVGVAVKQLQSVIEMYQKVFQLQPAFEEVVEDQKVKVAGFKIGNSTIEYLEPIADDSPISKFLDKRGEGIHHICIAVDDIEATLARLKAHGIPLIDEKPRIGAEGKLIAFIHPKGMNGILVELSQSN